MNRFNSFDQLYSFTLSVLLCLVICAPLSFALLRSSLIFFLLVVSVLILFYQKLEKKYIIILLLYLLYNSLSIVYGLFRGNAGSLRVASVYLVWPVAYSIIFLVNRNRGNIFVIDKALIVGLILISVLDCLYLASLYKIIYIPSSFFAATGIRFLGDAIEHEISVDHTSTFVFLLPYLFARIVLLKKRPVWMIVLFSIGVFIAFSTGRRSLLLLVCLSPVTFLIVYRIICKHHYKIYLKTILIILVSLVVLLFLLLAIIEKYFGMSIDFIIEYFMTGFNFAGDYAASLRLQQFVSLMGEWIERPIFGKGAGAVCATIIRSKEMPWSYELSYCATLFQRGIVGLFLCIIMVFFCLRNGRKQCSNNPKMTEFTVPLICGLFSMIIAHGTNPYLTTGGNEWMFFLPIIATTYSFKQVRIEN